MGSALRHTHSTLLLEVGVAISVVSRLLGQALRPCHRLAAGRGSNAAQRMPRGGTIQPTCFQAARPS